MYTLIHDPSWNACEWCHWTWGKWEILSMVYLLCLFPESGTNPIPIYIFLGYFRIRGRSKNSSLINNKQFVKNEWIYRLNRLSETDSSSMSWSLVLVLEGPPWQWQCSPSLAGLSHLLTTLQLRSKYLGTPVTRNRGQKLPCTWFCGYWYCFMRPPQYFWQRWENYRALNE